MRSSQILASFLALFLVQSTAWSQVLSPMGEEVELSYSARFLLSEEFEDDLDEAVENHSSYLMGVIKAERFVESQGVRYVKSEGIGAPRLPHKISAIREKQLADGQIEVSYNYRAKALVHKNAVKKALAKGYFEVALPYDTNLVYDAKCTDAHYDSFEDYWYFWDPYRKGCEKILMSPATEKVQVNVRTITYKKLEERARLDLVRGNNGNGKLFQIDIITGFDETGARKDIGWEIFKRLNRSLESEFEFSLESKSGSAKAPLHTYRRSLGSGVEVLVRHLVVDTALDSRSKAFAKFFKDSVENADVIVYSGHSGLGGNLDLPSLQAKAGSFQFNPKKRQIFFLSSCSSYSYYLDHFKAEKTKARIDILSNALAAYMDEDSNELRAFLRILLDEEKTAPLWMDVMKEMEAANPWDMTYLLNVGGV